MKSYFILVALSLAAAACTAAPPPKTPGAEPGDMTPQGHQAASNAEAGDAEEHREEAGRVPVSKSSVEERERSTHLKEAAEADKRAADHADAAKKAAGSAEK